MLHLARFTLEARTALSIGTGGSDGIYDHPIVRDANGLPIIPGTSLAGVLRHLWITEHGQTASDKLFGYQERDRGAASRLEVATCVLQDSRGRPIEGLLIGSERERLKSDALLRAALASREDPVFRDRVRLTHRGVAKHRGKFDRSVLLAGYRFSGELRLWSEHHDDPGWTGLLALLGDPRLRLGGATRAGLGAVSLKSLHTACFDLNGKPDDIARFQALPETIGDTTGLKITTLPSADSRSPIHQLRLRLKANDFWRIGQGNKAFGQYDKTPDLLPKAEPAVLWNKQGHGQIEPRLALIPASSIKGALAHRTAFHWNVLNSNFVEKMAPESMADWDASEHCEAVQELFGYAKDRETSAGRARNATGRAGRILIDDIYLPIPGQQGLGHLMHNSIDRFTGGVRNRMLFSEELLYQQSIDLIITLLPGVEGTDPNARLALARALDDLCAGRLALGAGSVKGHGTFSGQPLDEETRIWLKAQKEKR
ncbi:RAMP superfamily CRISPR-associated protein [Thiocapsa imhoffii]|uniref:RAMP superfamily CRISPR-associated protein n=1 Tax=Thiocapsa imhoffii TaxID=382777 RepID=UPI00190768E5